MTYVDLQRDFIPVKKDEEVNVESRRWGKLLGGWLNWNDLLNRKRVILLAEASSGKTEEFKAVTQRLKQTDKIAFFITIEDLADEGIENSLNSDDISAFKK